MAIFLTKKWNKERTHLRL